MNEIKKQVSRARRRINVGLFFRALIVSLTAGLVIGSIAFAIPRIWSVDWIQTTEQLQKWQVGWGLGAIGVGLLGAMIYMLNRSAKINQAALEVDRRFGLKERISSALTLSNEEAATPAGRSLMADAEERAKRIDIADQFGFQFKRRTLMPLVPAAIVIGLLFVPTRQLPQSPTLTQTSAEKEKIEKAIEETKFKVEEQAKKLAEKGLQKAAEDVKTIARQIDELNAENSEVKKEALVKINDLIKKLGEEKDKLGNPEDLKKEFGRIKDVSPGPGKEMAEAMKEGDFDKAQKIAKELAEKIRDGKLNEAEQKKIVDNLNKVAKAVDEIAKQHEKEKVELKDQIKKAMENGDLQKAAELQDKLDKKAEKDNQIKKMQDVANKMQKCADCMNKGPGKENDKNNAGKNKSQQGKNGKNEEAGKNGEPKKGEGKNEPQPGGKPADQEMKDAQQALEDLAEMMEQLEKDQDAMDALKDLEKDLQECKGNCQGGMPNEGGDPNKRAKGDWAKGEGKGHGKREMEENETKNYKSKVKVEQLHKGQTIVAGEADGENAKTGSVIESREIVKQSMQKENDPIEDQNLPKAQREQARQYFERLRKGN